MRLVLTLIIVIFFLGACGKKSDPKYQGNLNNLITMVS